MSYFFGSEGAKSIEEAFHKHYAVCPFCKSEDNRTDPITNRMECHVSLCRGKWEPKKLTPENMVAFKEFINQRF